MMAEAIDTPPHGVRITRAANGFEIRARVRSPFIWLIVAAATAWSAFILFALIPEAPQRTPPPVQFFLAMVVAAFFMNILLVFGEYRVGRNGDLGWIAFGIGALSRTRRFAWRDVESIREEPSRWRRRGGGRLMQLRLVGPPKLAFGVLLGRSRRAAIIDALHALQGWR